VKGLNVEKHVYNKCVVTEIQVLDGYLLVLDGVFSHKHFTGHGKTWFNYTRNYNNRGAVFVWKV